MSNKSVETRASSLEEVSKFSETPNSTIGSFVKGLYVPITMDIVTCS